MGLAGKIVAESLRVVGKGTWNLLNSHPAKMLIGGAALFMAVEIGSNGSGIVNGISNWTHGFATHAPQQSPQGFETKLEQNTTSGMHGGIFWQAEFSQGIIKQPTKANIAAAIVVTMDAMSDHSPAAAVLAACDIAVENGEMSTYWKVRFERTLNKR